MSHGNNSHDDDDDDGFVGYVEKTNDPGPSILVFTTLFCLFSQLVLPFLVVLGSRRDRRRKARNVNARRAALAAEREGERDGEGEAAEAEVAEADPANGVSDPARIQEIPLGKAGGEGARQRRVPPYESHVAPSPYSVWGRGDDEESLRRSGGGCADNGAAARPQDSTFGGRDYVDAGSYAGSVGGFGSKLERFLDELAAPSSFPDDRSEAGSSILGSALGSTLGSAMSINTSPLDAGFGGQARWHRHGGLKRRLRRRVKRGEVDGFAGTAQMQQLRARSRHFAAAATSDSGAAPVHDFYSVPPRCGASLPAPSIQRSAAGPFEEDGPPPDTSPQAAASGKDAGPGPPEERGGAGGEGDRRLDLCCGPRALWKPAVLSEAWESLLRIAEYDRESKRIVKLMVPFTAGAVLEGIFEGVTLAIISWHLGTDALAAYAVADLFMEISAQLLAGFTEAESVLCAHAIGAGNYHLAGQYIQLSWFVWFVTGIPIMFVWSYLTDDALLLLGFSPAVASMAQDWATIGVWASFIDGFTGSLESLCELTDREVFVLVIDVVAHLIDVLVIFAMLHTSDGATLRDVAIVELTVEISFLIIIFVIMKWRGWLEPYWEGMAHTFAVKNRVALYQMFKTGIPLAFGSLIAEGEWEVLIIFASHMGDAEVAAWAVMGTIWGIFESCTEGIGGAAEIRCAYHLGKGNPELAKNSSYKSLLIGTMFSIVATSMFFIMGDDIPVWFTSDATLQNMMRELIPFVGIGNMMMSFGMVSWTLVGAQGRYRLATLIAFTSSWIVTVPLAAFFVYGMQWDLQGLTAAVVIGYSITGTALSYVLLRSNWIELTAIVQKINMELGEVLSSDSDEDEDESQNEGGYSTMAWAKLPRDGRRAAKTLGYTNATWDAGDKGLLDDKSWNELTIEQQRAAVIVGYDEEKWNGSDNSSSGSGFNAMDWADLPADARGAAETLGYTQTTWEDGGKAMSDEKNWSYLTAEERRAAIVLGYDTDDWNAGEDSVSSSHTSSSGFSSMDWDELPCDARRAAETLGYTKHVWPNFGNAVSDRKDWKNFSQEERIAAIVLGYDEQKWKDGNYYSTCSSSGGFSSMSWSELPADANEAAEMLGYDQYAWDCNGRVPADDKTWDELTSKERFAATVLGYDDEMWNVKPGKAVTIS